MLYAHFFFFTKGKIERLAVPIIELQGAGMGTGRAVHAIHNLSLSLLTISALCRIVYHSELAGTFEVNIRTATNIQTFILL